MESCCGWQNADGSFCDAAKVPWDCYFESEGPKSEAVGFVVGRPDDGNLFYLVMVAAIVLLVLGFLPFLLIVLNVCSKLLLFYASPKFFYLLLYVFVFVTRLTVTITTLVLGKIVDQAMCLTCRPVASRTLRVKRRWEFLALIWSAELTPIPEKYRVNVSKDDDLGPSSSSGEAEREWNEDEVIAELSRVHTPGHPTPVLTANSPSYTALIKPLAHTWEEHLEKSPDEKMALRRAEAAVRETEIRGKVKRKVDLIGCYSQTNKDREKQNCARTKFLIKKKLEKLDKRFEENFLMKDTWQSPAALLGLDKNDNFTTTSVSGSDEDGSSKLSSVNDPSHAFNAQSHITEFAGLKQFLSIARPQPPVQQQKQPLSSTGSSNTIQTSLSVCYDLSLKHAKELGLYDHDIVSLNLHSPQRAEIVKSPFTTTRLGAVRKFEDLQNRRRQERAYAKRRAQMATGFYHSLWIA